MGARSTLRNPLAFSLTCSLLVLQALGETPSADKQCSNAMKGRMALVTGATGQIGREIALGVARSGYTTILTCRDEERGGKLVQEIATESGGDVRLEVVDLSSVKSIKSLASQLSDKYPELHLLVNNAATTEQTRKLSTDGLEMQFAVNVQAYLSLMKSLAPLLSKAGATPGGQSARVVNVASQYAGLMDVTDLNFEKREYDATTAYKQSKQANRMITKSAAAELFAGGGVTVMACHPGVVTSPLLQNLGVQRGNDTPAEGAATPLLLALGPAVEGKTAGYYVSQKAYDCPYQKDAAGCATVWAYCDQVHERVN